MLMTTHTLPFPHRGLGQTMVPAAVSTAGGAFSGISSALIASGTVSTAGASGAFLAAAIPIIGPVIAGVTIGLSLLFARKGPRQKVATTSIVNQVEPLLAQNLDGYFQGPRNAAAREQALHNFDAAWTWLIQHCAIPEMGDPGQWCVNDRQQGACKWRQTTEGYEKHPYAGVPKPGECWNWLSGYRDPIANDPGVQETDLSHSISSEVGNLFSSGSGLPKWLLIPAAGLLAWWAVS